MKLSNVILWIALISLTVVSFYSSEGSYSGRSLALILMAIVVIKFLGIGLQYVELKHAHPVWKVLFTGFILVFSLLVVLFV